MKFVFRKKLIISFVIIVLLFIIFFVGRQLLFAHAIKKFSNKLNEKYNLNLVISKSEFHGFTSIAFRNIVIKNKNEDTVFFADSVFLQLRIWPGVNGKLRFREFIASTINVNFSGELYDKIFHHHLPIDSLVLNKHTSYAENINKIFTSLFSLAPNYAELKNCSFNYNRNEFKFSLSVPKLLLKNGKFESELITSEAGNKSSCSISGEFNKSTENIYFKIGSSLKQPFCLPYIDQKWGLTVKFDTISLNLNKHSLNWGVTNLDGNAIATNFSIQHKKIAPTAVNLKVGEINFKINAGDKYIELDSASEIMFNHFSFKTYLKYQHNGEKEIFLKIPKTQFEATDFFDALPSGLFTSLRGINVSGKLAYMLNFYINQTNPDSIALTSQLESNGFRINHFGQVNFEMINDTFTYVAYDHDIPVAKIMVGENNPNFVKLDDISPFLKYSVLTSEDGDFFYHRGFNEEAFKNSISENIKQKRFARGGSTITMQLVKNVFLNQNKTISRKIEEMLIVWMIENLHLVSKERMFEVYLNIIEWGPGIYGIKKAAKFYFKKKPSELTLNESIFLASIIPSPKYFQYAFKEPGILTNYYAWFYSRLPDVMIRRNQISAEDTIGLKPVVWFKGQANKYLEKRDTTILNHLGTNDLLLQDLEIDENEDE